MPKKKKAYLCYRCRTNTVASTSHICKRCQRQADLDVAIANALRHQTAQPPMNHCANCNTPIAIHPDDDPANAYCSRVCYAAAHMHLLASPRWDLDPEG